MKALIKLNLIGVALLLTGLLVEKVFGWTVLRGLGALPFIFFLPGYNLSYLLFPRMLSLLERIILALLSSFVVISLALYLPLILLKISYSGDFVIAATSVVWFLTLVAGMVGLYFHTEQLEAENWTVLGWGLLIYFILLLLIFAVYPFIPEADPYAYLILSQDFAKDGLVASHLALRPLFIVLTSSISILGNIPMHAIFKYLLPSFGFITLLPIFARVRLKLQDQGLMLLALLLPVTAPVVLLETVITRPQSMVLFTLPGIIYLLHRSIVYRLPWLSAYLLGLTLIYFKFHELAFLLTIVAAMTTALTVWPHVKKHPKLTLAFALLIAFALHPYLASSTILGKVNQTYAIIASRLNPLTFRLWFLGNYTNIDGVSVGWPGLSFIRYYGYNLGLFIPFLLILQFRKAAKKITWVSLSPIWLSLFLFFSIAEILPRFNVTYLPDRAWPFLILSLALLGPDLISRAQPFFKNRLGLVTATVLVGLSVVASLYISYQKQGWVTRKEYRAAMFLKTHTPQNSIILSQGSNGPLINYYADRTLATQNIFAPGIGENQIIATANRLSQPASETDELVARKKVLIGQISSTLTNLDTLSASQYSDLIEIQNQALRELAAISKKLETTKPVKSDRPAPIYILYSLDKFNSLYATRSWWQNINYPNADLNKFNSPAFNLLFDNGLVKIWQVTLPQT